jgi:hypothetical protein
MSDLALTSTTRQSIIAWGAIVAGALVAAAVLFLLLGFGAAAGLSVISPWSASGTAVKAVGLLAAAWFLVAAAASFWSGGYLASRLRNPWADLSVIEARSRDRMHGVVVWAIGVIIFVFLGVAVSAGVIAEEAAIGGAQSAAEAYTLDTLFRRAPDAPATNNSWNDAHREEAARLLAHGVAPSALSPDEHAYLVRMAETDAAVSHATAEARVKDAIADTKKMADAARLGAITTGFLSVTGLFIALLAARMGATRGGRRREALTASR